MLMSIDVLKPRASGSGDEARRILRRARPLSPGRRSGAIHHRMEASAKCSPQILTDLALAVNTSHDSLSVTVWWSFPRLLRVLTAIFKHPPRCKWAVGCRMSIVSREYVDIPPNVMSGVRV